MTRAQALRHWRGRFAAAGLDSPALDARILLAEALGLETSSLAVQGDEPLAPEEAARLAAYAERRLAREPVARILGRREFWGLPFVLSPDTLVPRPDTETVVEAALDHKPERDAPLRLLDLGTGSGCLLVALLRERPRALGVGVDRSFGALAAARENARRNGVGERAFFAAGDWASALRGPFDLVVSNPPYIPSRDVESLDTEVRGHDPRLALDGGGDGLEAYRRILGEAPTLLAPGGVLVLEIGYDQAESVPALALSRGFAIREIRRDLGGHARCVVAAAPGSSTVKTP